MNDKRNHQRIFVPVPGDIGIRRDRGQWTHLTLVALRELWGLGYSTMAIGEYIGFSKNAVVGKSHRMELAPRPSPIKRTDEERRRHKKHVPVTSPLPPLPSATQAAEGYGPPVALPAAKAATPRPRPTQAPIFARPPSPFSDRVYRPVVPEPPPVRHGRVIDCQSVTNSGQYGIGIEFCSDADGNPSKSVPGRVYCEACCARNYLRVRDRREPEPNYAIGSRWAAPLAEGSD